MVGRTENDRRRSLSGSVEEDVCEQLLRAAGTLTRCIEQALKPSRLTLSQYNALEVLGGAGPDGMACHEIGDRMTSRDPDITRILDRLETRNLVSRSRAPRDRRVILARLTQAGVRLLNELRPSVAALRGHLLRDLEKARLRGLVEPLAQIHENGTVRPRTDQRLEQRARASGPGR